MMTAWHFYFRKLFPGILLLGSPVFNCAPPKCGYVVTTPYKASFFKSSTFTGRSIALVPLLRDGGMDTTGLLAGGAQLQKINENRRDLKCVPFLSVASKIKTRFGDVLLQEFMANLYKGDVSVLQTSDSVWNSIGEDFMMVIRMKTAHSIRTFSGDVRKRIVLEGELWDCRKAEAVFRINVNGICLTESVRDDKFIMDGIIAIYKELPAPSPAYDTQVW